MRHTLRRALTADRGPPGGANANYIDILENEQLSARMSKLPNGSLLCRDVPIARVGWLVYGPGETPMPVGSHGVAYIERTAAELFSEETIGSFMAATVTDNHPPGDVVPENWKSVAKGFTTTNVRQGTGDDADVLLADLVITDRDLIDQVLNGKREVSCGYEADYFQTAPGVGLQRNIRGNHIALVTKGRCGPRCSIRDQALSTPSKETEIMKRTPLKTARRALVDTPEVAAARSRLQAAQDELLDLEDGDEDDGIHVHIHTNDAATGTPTVANPDEDRISRLEESVMNLAGCVQELTDKLTPATGKTADELNAEALAAAAVQRASEARDPVTGKTVDAATAATSYTQLIAQCEVLVPGYRMPTFDAAATPAVMVDAMGKQRTRCLEMAYATKDGQALIDSIGGTKDIDFSKMDGAATAVLFNASVVLKAQSNNRAATADAGRTPAKKDEVRHMPTFTDINEANQKFWAAQSGSTPA